MMSKIPPAGKRAMCGSSHIYHAHGIEGDAMFGFDRVAYPIEFIDGE
jgi:hypothetical protein